MIAEVSPTSRASLIALKLSTFLILWRPHKDALHSFYYTQRVALSETYQLLSANDCESRSNNQVYRLQSHQLYGSEFFVYNEFNPLYVGNTPTFLRKYQ